MPAIGKSQSWLWHQSETPPKPIFCAQRSRGPIKRQSVTSADARARGVRKHQRQDRWHVDSTQAGNSRWPIGCHSATLGPPHASRLGNHAARVRARVVGSALPTVRTQRRCLRSQGEPLAVTDWISEAGMAHYAPLGWVSALRAHARQQPVASATPATENPPCYL